MIEAGAKLVATQWFEDRLVAMTDSGDLYWMDPNEARWNYLDSAPALNETLVKSLVYWRGNLIICTEDGETWMLEYPTSNEMRRWARLLP